MRGDEPKIPYLNGAIFASRDQPLSLAVETHRGDIGVVTLKCKQLAAMCKSHLRTTWKVN